MEKLKKLLIVEDEPMVRRALVEGFADSKAVTVLSAKDGKEGIDAALREHPDFILLDILMPVMNGMDMLTSLREDEWGSTAQVMMLSNLADTEKISEAAAKGVKYFVVKSNSNIRAIINKVLAIMDGKEPSDDELEF